MNEGTQRGVTHQATDRRVRPGDVQRLLERSTQVRDESQALVAQSRELGFSVLSLLTRIADTRPTVDPDRLRRLQLVGGANGRDAHIEEAKVVLRQHFGIGGMEAFDIIRVLSQRENRKAREIARELISRYKAS